MHCQIAPVFCICSETCVRIVIVSFQLASPVAQICCDDHADEESSPHVREAPPTKASSNNMPGVGEEQLIAADLPERVDQIVNLDHPFSAGQAVPNLRSLHRQLPSSGQTSKTQSGQADSATDSDTFIIPMVQLGSAGVRQVTTCNSRTAALITGIQVRPSYPRLRASLHTG